MPRPTVTLGRAVERAEQCIDKLQAGLQEVVDELAAELTDEQRAKLQALINRKIGEVELEKLKHILTLQQLPTVEQPSDLHPDE